MPLCDLMMRGHPCQIVDMVENITERRLAEDELQKARGKLEARIKERTAELLYDFRANLSG